MDSTTGQLVLQAGNFIPAGLIACSGQLLGISALPDLYDAIGTTFGGDGVSTFALPAIPSVASGNGGTATWCVVADSLLYAGDAPVLLGEVRPFLAPPAAGSDAAQIWVPCDGSLLGTSDYDAVFYLLGTVYGGDGVTTFALPSLPPMRLSNGKTIGFYISVAGVFPECQCNAVSVDATASIGGYGLYMGSIVRLPYQQQYLDALCGLGLCNGQLVSIPVLQKLFLLIGTTFGGDGASTFALPNLQTGPGSLTYAMVTNGIYPSSTG